MAIWCKKRKRYVVEYSATTKVVQPLAIILGGKSSHQFMPTTQMIMISFY